MEHTNNIEYPQTNRVGFHYFDDTLHFGESDAQCWLPVIKKLNVNWLVLQSSIFRAIPESFIQVFRSEGINLIADFNLRAGDPFSWSDIEPLINAYGKWGIKYVLLNKQPNIKESWTPDGWADPQIVSKYSQQFLEFAQISLENGIRPIYSPLFPGGKYLDLAFVEDSVNWLIDHANLSVINNLTFSAYAWDHGHALDWGIGGRAAQPKNNFFQVSKNQQSQKGFRTYEWYSEIIETKFSKKMPFILFQIGFPGLSDQFSIHHDFADINKLMAVHKLLNRENVYDPEEPQKILNHIPEYVISGNFFILSSNIQQHVPYQWFSNNSEALPPAQAFFIRNTSSDNSSVENNLSEKSFDEKEKLFEFNRYILISETLQPQTDNLIEALQPYIVEHKPVIGYSVADAARSAVILIIGSHDENMDSHINHLRLNGSLVKHIHPDEISTMKNEKNYDD